MQPVPPNPSTRAWVWTGSAFAPSDSLPVTDRGFRYGMSVFESFPVRKGTPLFLPAHLKRLRNACAETGLAAPPEALAECGALFKKAGDGFARIYVTAGDGPVTAPCDAGRVLVLLEERPPIDADTRLRGYDLGIHKSPYVPFFNGMKTGNYWSNLHAYRTGVAAGWNESLLFNRAGHLISACMANVFILRGGSLLTPALEMGARAGVVREWVLQHVMAEEALVPRADVDAATEIFLTSSWLGIMPAFSLEQRPLKARTIAKPLWGAYQTETKSK